MKRHPLFKEWMGRPTLIITLIYLVNNPPNYPSKILKEIYTTHQGLWKTLKYLSKRKLIYSIRKGKFRYIYLTKKGKETATKLEELDSIFNNVTIQ